MITIGSIKTWKPGRGSVTVWSASTASRAAALRAGRDPLPPTFQQRQHVRAAYLARKENRLVPRLILAAWDMDGRCDLEAMTATVNTHLRRNDTYRSWFEVSGSQVVRHSISRDLIEFVPTPLGVLDDDEIRDLLLNGTPGTLEWDCFTFGVIQKDNHFTTYANIDHLHTDGLSAVLVHREITDVYRALSGGGALRLPRPAEYRDFAARQQRALVGLRRDSPSVRSWLEFLEESGGVLPRSPVMLGDTASSGPGTVRTVELLNGADTAAFDRACDAAGVRLSGGVLACAALADHRLTRAEVFRIVTPAANRYGFSAPGVGWYASVFPVSVPLGAGRFAHVAYAAQTSFDKNRHLSGIPVKMGAIGDLHANTEPGNTGGPPMMLSLFDFHDSSDGGQDHLGLYIDDLSHGELNVWITRNNGDISATASFPDNAVAHRSVARYLHVLRSVFSDVARTGSLARTLV